MDGLIVAKARHNGASYLWWPPIDVQVTVKSFTEFSDAPMRTVRVKVYIGKDPDRETIFVLSEVKLDGILRNFPNG